jgi:hypothetical protein
MPRRISLIVLIVLLASMEAAGAQGLAPAAPFQSRLTLQGPGQNSAVFTHRDSLGRPCLDIEAASRAHVINPNVYDHVVSVYNKCLSRIRLQVCYFGTGHCIDVDVSGLQRKDAVLGVYPSLQYFRFSYREKP